MRLAATNLRSLYAFDLLSVEGQDMRLEADDEPLQVRPVRIVGEGEEPGLGAAINRMDGGTVSASRDPI